MPDTITTAGATPAEWARLACSEAAQWALPVQCNPAVPLSPRSSIKAAGKLPSIKNAQGQIAGIPGWTAGAATPTPVSASAPVMMASSPLTPISIPRKRQKRS